MSVDLILDTALKMMLVAFLGYIFINEMLRNINSCARAFSDPKSIQSLELTKNLMSMNQPFCVVRFKGEKSGRYIISYGKTAVETFQRLETLVENELITSNKVIN